MKRRVVVTGLGVVTSLSCEVEDLWQRILRGESGIHELRLFDTSDHKVKFAGDVWDWNPTDYITPKELKRLDRFSSFALVEKGVCTSVNLPSSLFQSLGSLMAFKNSLILSSLF